MLMTTGHPSKTDEKVREKRVSCHEAYSNTKGVAGIPGKYYLSRILHMSGLWAWFSGWEPFGSAKFCEENILSLPKACGKMCYIWNQDWNLWPQFQKVCFAQKQQCVSLKETHSTTWWWKCLAGGCFSSAGTLVKVEGILNNSKSQWISPNPMSGKSWRDCYWLT